MTRGQPSTLDNSLPRRDNDSVKAEPLAAPRGHPLRRPGLPPTRSETLFRLAVLAMLTASCQGHSKATHGQGQSTTVQEQPEDTPELPLVEVGAHLSPYLGKTVRIVGEVSNTKYPSLGNGWLTIWALENHRGTKVEVRGTVTQHSESTVSPDGTIMQGRDGVFFHLEEAEVKSMAGQPNP